MRLVLLQYIVRCVPILSVYLLSITLYFLLIYVMDILQLCRLVIRLIVAIQYIIYIYQKLCQCLRLNLTLCQRKTDHKTTNLLFKERCGKTHHKGRLSCGLEEMGSSDKEQSRPEIPAIR